MSDKVDKRIVELEFDNEQFKKGVADTLDKMKQLSGALDFKSDTSGIKDLNNAISNVDTASLVSGVQKVKMEFNLLQEVASAAIQNIVGSIMDSGARLINEFTLQPVTDGLNEYTLKMNSIKTIETNTMGQANLEQINGALSELNNYADKTIYNFAEMTKNIGTFTAAGVDLKTSTQAIQGIANVAAASGASSAKASNAMYQLSQALAAGSLKLQDWNSVVNSDMGGQLFQNALIRTSEALGTGAMDAIANQGSFRESLQEGWATSEVLTKTLRNMTMATSTATEEQIQQWRSILEEDGYTLEQMEEIFAEANAAQEAATKVRTFEQLIDTTKEAMGSGWAQTWEYIIGDIHEAETFFTMVSETINGVINGMSDARNEIFKIWHAEGGRDAIFMAFVEFANVIQDLVEPIAKAFSSIFEPIDGKKLAEGSKALQSYITGIRDFFENTETGKAILTGIEEAFKIVFGTIKTVGTVVFGAVQIGFTLVENIFKAIFIVVENLITFLKNSGVIDFITGMISGIGSVIEGAKEAIINGFNLITDTLAKPLEKIKKIFDDVVNAIGTFLNDNIISRINAFFDSFGGIDNIKTAAMDFVLLWIENLVGVVSSALDFLTPIIGFFADTFTQALQTFSGFLSEIDIFGALKSIGDEASKIYNDIFPTMDENGVVKLSETSKALSEFVDALNGVRDAVLGRLKSAFEFLIDVFSKIWHAISPMVDDIKNRVLRFWDDLKNVFKNSGLSFDGLLAHLDEFGNSFTKLFENGIPTFEDFVKFFENIWNNFGSLISDLGPKIGQFFMSIGDAVRKQLDGPLAAFWDFIAGIGSIDIVGAISNIPKAISDTFSGIGGTIQNPFENIFSFGKSEASNTSPMTGVFGNVEDQVKQETSIIDVFKNAMEQFGNPLDRIKEFFSVTIPDVITSIFKGINDAIKNAPTDAIKDFIGEITAIGMSASALWGSFEINKLMGSMADVADDVDEIVKTAKDSLETITEVVKSLGKTADKIGKATARSINANAFLKFVGGIALMAVALAGCMKLISTIENPTDALITMGILMGIGVVFAGLIAVLSRIAADGDKTIKSIGIVFGSMSLMFLSIAKVIQVVSSIENPEKYYKILIGIGGFVLLFGLLAGAVGYFSENGLKGAAVLLSMAFAINYLSNVLMKLADIPVDEFDKGMVQLLKLVGLLVVPIVMLGMMGTKVETAGIAMLSLAGSLIILGMAFQYFGSIEQVDFGPFVVGMGLLLGVLYVMKSLKLTDELLKASASMLILSGAIALLGVALRLLGTAFGGDAEAVVLVLLGLGAALALFALSLNMAGGAKAIASAAGILIVCGALSLLLGVIYMMTTISWDQLLKAAVILGIVLVALAGLAIAINFLAGPLAVMNMTLLGLGAALMLIVGSFTLFVATLIGAAMMAPAAVQSLIDAFNLFKSEMEGREEEFIQFGYTLGAALGAVAIGFFDQIGKAVTDFFSKIDIGAAISDLGKNALNAVLGLGPMILDGIMGLGKTMADGFASVFSNSVEEGVSTINPDLQNENADWAKPAAEAAGDQYVESTVDSIEAGSEEIKNVTEETMETAGEAGADAASESIEENINPDENKMMANIDYDTMAKLFGDGTAEAMTNGDFSSSFEGLGGMMSGGLLDGVGKNQIDPSQMFSKMGLGDDKLNAQSKTTGNNIGSEIMGGTAESLDDTTLLEGGIDKQIESINNQNEKYSTAGQQSGTSYINGFNEMLSAENATENVAINADALSAGIEPAAEAGRQSGQAFGTNQLDAISSMSTLIAMNIKQNMYDAAAQSDSAGAGVIAGTKFNEGTISGIVGRTSDTIKAVAESLIRAASESDPGGKGFQTGQWFSGGTMSGVESRSNEVVDTVVHVLNTASSDSDPGGKGFQAGQWFGRGMESGILDCIDEIAEAAAEMVREAKEAADEEADSASPSKEMIKRGHWFDDGMRVGIEEYSSRVSSAAGSMTKDAMDNASGAFSVMGKLVDGIDWDANPTITPVLDLDKFRADAAAMGGFIPDSQVVSAMYAGNRLEGGYGNVLNAQNEANGMQNNIYVTLDWKAGTTPNQMVKMLADELQTFNLTRGR